MQVQSVDQQSEQELAFWKSRIASLESVVCELLISSEKLRAGLRMSQYEAKSAAEFATNRYWQ